MRIGAFNVQNLFMRARALDLETGAEGREALTKHAELNRVLAKNSYTSADKNKIVDLLIDLGMEKSDEGPFVILRQNKGKLLKRPKTGGIEIVAQGRSSWLGWVDLKMKEVNETAVRMTARVIHDVGADVLGVVEAESRPALCRFSENVIPTVGGTPYESIMLIDGNDDRGIDVGIMLRAPYKLERIVSHVDDRDGEGRIFSRDCAESWVRTPSGETVVMLVNHLKSKGYGSQAANDARRKRQARRVKDIYEDLVADGQNLVAVLGGLNAPPDSAALDPLLDKTDLRDIAAHPTYVAPDGRPGTFGNGNKGDKIDYILLSPELFKAVTAAGGNRLGVWGGKNGTLFPHYPEITQPSEAASDHAALWVDVSI